MQSFFCANGFPTINMPASWRSSTGKEPLDQIIALAGCDRMTIPPPLLERLANTIEKLPRRVEKTRAATPSQTCPADTESEFRLAMCQDGAANDKVAAGIRAFLGDTAKLLEVLEPRVRAAL